MPQSFPKGRCTITSAPRRRSRSASVTVWATRWEPLRHIRDDPALTGLQKLQAVFAVSFAGQRQQQIAQTLPHLCSNPQFLAMELTNIEAHLAPECIAPMIRQGMADGSIHTANANALAEALFVLADIWLSPRRAPPRRPSSGRGTSCFSK